MTKARLHECACSSIEWLAGRAQHVVDDRRYVVDRLARSCAALERLLLPALFTTATHRVIATRALALQDRGRSGRGRRSCADYLSITIHVALFISLRSALNLYRPTIELADVRC